MMRWGGWIVQIREWRDYGKWLSEWKCAPGFLQSRKRKVGIKRTEHLTEPMFEKIWGREPVFGSVPGLSPFSTNK